MARLYGKIRSIKSINWYLQGLAKAKEVKDELMTKQFSTLVMLSL